MFNPAPYLAALRTSGLFVAAVRGAPVLLVYLCHMWQTGTAWPKVETIAQLTGLSPRAVRQQRAALVAAGLLVRDGQKGIGGYAVPAFKLANLADVQQKQPAKLGFIAPTGLKYIAAHRGSSLPPRAEPNFSQKVKQDLKQKINKQNRAAGLSAAAAASLGEVGISGAILHQLAALVPAIEPADVREAMARAGKARARSATGWAISWLKSEERTAWQAAQGRKAAAQDKAAAAGKAAAQDKAAARRQLDQDNAALDQLIGAMTAAEIKHHRSRYIETLSPALRSQLANVASTQLIGRPTFRAYIAQEFKCRKT